MPEPVANARTVCSRDERETLDAYRPPSHKDLLLGVFGVSDEEEKADQL